MSESHASPSGRQRFGLALTGALLLAAAGASYLGVRGPTAVAPPVGPAPSAAALPEEVEVPPGPHRAEFQTSCVICHSPRLALNQPPFKEAKWAEIVHKMVAAYGAPLTKDDEDRVVEYLLAAQTAR